ncbi:hypothetical protein [Haloarcula sp. CBA1127]|uniref:hypothetical protein n=1 Tax=Haloarcula sp. CBA1127 TaxID=1765055 RepID=UPI000A81F018|nr:hypothetical protein [Haloarcula sp. CBA1127]
MEKPEITEKYIDLSTGDQIRLQSQRTQGELNKETSLKAEVSEQVDGGAFVDPKTIVFSEDGQKYHLQPFKSDVIEIDLHKVNPDGSREYLGVLTELDIETS